MQTLIKVTQEDISEGKRMDSCYCPVALALGRECKTNVSVCRDSIHIGKKINIACPQIAKKFIDRFDSGYLVEAIEFYINY
jgi:hypothetical protein